MILITGATGHLGTLTIETLQKRHPNLHVVAGVRDLQKARHYTQQGIETRVLDYDRPDTLTQALQGIDTLVLISSNGLSRRATQHQAVIAAATAANIKRIVYTSLLHAPTSAMLLALDHVKTEQMIVDANISHVILRNSWYTENYAGAIPTALQIGQIFGSAGEGKIAAASRENYAEAIVAALVHPAPKSVYELAGSHPFTLSELALELSKQTGKDIRYTHMSKEVYAAALVAAGLPDALAAMLADADDAASRGGLFGKSDDFEALIGHPTVTLSEAVRMLLDTKVS